MQHRSLLVFIWMFSLISCGLFAQGTDRTLTIIKPDGVEANHIGDILGRFEKDGFHIAAVKMTRLSKEKAKEFYAEHKERPFYNDLVNFMSSGPIVVAVLEAPNAVLKGRELIGSTNPQKAGKGTIRAEFGKSTEQNAVHGSDSLESAKREISFFFRSEEIFR